MLRTIMSNPCKRIQDACSQIVIPESVSKVAKYVGFFAISAFSFKLAVGSLALYGFYKVGSPAYAEYREQQKLEAEEAQIREQCIERVEEFHRKANEQMDARPEFKPKKKEEKKKILELVFARIKQHSEYLSKGRELNWVQARIQEYVPTCRREYKQTLGPIERFESWLQDPKKVTKK